MLQNQPRHIHFVGIGGIGMSGIAQILAQKGYTISGCDTDCSQKSILLLQALGCPIASEHNSTLCHDATIDTLVYSTDIRDNNPELQRAQQANITILHRSEILAYVMTLHKNSIGITGSHGKTTTTSLASHIFLTAQTNPTVVVGGILSTINSNACTGDGNILIAEADESDRSLLNLPVTYAILTSISAEHLNIYKDITDVQNTFIQFLNNIPTAGISFVCLDDQHIRMIIPRITTHIETYGTAIDADWYITNIILEPSISTFTLHYKGVFFGDFTLNIPGIHNVRNATATIALAHSFGISIKFIQQALISFAGVDRRFTYKGKTNEGAEIFDDYGHHPAELACTFEVARKRAQGRFVLLFQPHRYTRIHALWQDFITILASPLIDELIITDLHAANEDPIAGITGETLFNAFIKQHPHIKATYKPLDTEFSSLTTYLHSTLKEHDLVLIQGAGKITKIADKLVQKN